MRPSWWNWFVGAGVVLFIATPARAQPLFGHAKSIECTVADADIVVVGKILQFIGGEQPEGREATIAVEETLKGEPGQRLRARLSTRGTKDQSHRLLVAVKEDAPVETTVIDLSDDKLEVLTEDFTLLRNPEEVLRMAKETMRRMPGVRRIQSFPLIVPHEVIARTAWEKYYGTGGYLVLHVPVDERLERRAIESIRSPNYSTRQESARALRYFQSDANVARVKALLDDPEWAYLRHAEENQGLEVHVYGVRDDAYRTLKYWGVNAKEPVIQEEKWMLERVKIAALSNMKVTDEDLAKLARFENLEDLFLWNTEVMDASLAVIGRLKTLQTLYLGGTKVTSEGLKHLSGLTKLRYLDLRTTRVGDEAVRVLAGFKSLKKLDLGQTRVTDGGIAELRKLRPDIEIER